MEPNDLSGGGISSRFSGLAAALLRHLLTLGELAAEEARLLIRQSILAIILLVFLILSGSIAYLTLIAAVAALLAQRLEWGWPLALGAAALFHFALTLLLFVTLRLRQLPHPFEATTVELQRDLEALHSYSKNPSR